METPYTVDVSVLEGHISPHNSCKDQPISGEHELAAVSLQRWYMGPGIRRIEIRQNQVVGTLFLPPGEFNRLTQATPPSFKKHTSLT